MRLVKYVGAIFTIIISSYSLKSQSYKNLPNFSENMMVASKHLTKSEIYNTSITEINRIDVKNYTADVDIILTEARKWLGTPYRYGGTTRRGVDCSSFVQNTFNSLNIILPRTSALQSKTGENVALNEVKKGDLLFFRTRGRGVSHVAIVERVEESGEIFFIHSSSSKGVSINSLFDSYWNTKFLKAKRVINSR